MIEKRFMFGAAKAVGKGIYCVPPNPAIEF